MSMNESDTESDPVPMMIDCPKCQGAGRIPSGMGPAGTPVNPAFIACPDCQETGKVIVAANSILDIPTATPLTATTPLTAPGAPPASTLTFDDITAITGVIERTVDAKMAQLRTELQAALTALDAGVNAAMESQAQVVAWVQQMTFPDVVTGLVHEFWQRAIEGEMARVRLVAGEIHGGVDEAEAGEGVGDG